MHEGRRSPDLTELVERHHALLFRYAYRLCGSQCRAEDLTQQAFLAAHRKLDQLRDPDRAKGWLCSILRNTYLKEQRAGNGRVPVSLEDVAEPAEEGVWNGPVDEEELQAALDELPEPFRTPIVLFYFQEFTYREIAEQMEVPVGTVMSRLARAKAHLRNRLADREPAASGPQAG